MKQYFASFLTLIIVSSSLSAQTVSTGDHFKKVVWVVFENMDYEKALAQADFSALTKNSVLLTNLTAEAHPSQGNYIAMIAGSKLNVTNDSVVNLQDTHVGDLLEKAHMKWKVYAENYPGKCFIGKSSGPYARRHVPFMSFLDVTQDSARCLNIEDETNFFSDYNSGGLPEFSMYIPNVKNDGHDTGVDFAGKWLNKTFGSLISNPSKLGDVLFIITFDESGGTSKTNQVYTVLVGAKIKAGTQNTQPMNHTALLKMIEDEFGIGNLGREDAKAPVIEGIWK
ncbi:alkaline phosphatase family protein [Bacteriovorax sp. PP10]|uniref:Alkaline phosphatase family protein n=1 Tax=Bacteriovorax antarcticus TaxID=3088717 RepID=A0ABU5VZV9_9BACT|nr:alkaline phosphatase family protein [Bacteriovorax sp. PP10]MEA9357839.1 alkaline phosphatase family protein [Bacteriovorax sp. PP10]